MPRAPSALDSPPSVRDRERRSVEIGGRRRASDGAMRAFACLLFLSGCGSPPAAVAPAPGIFAVAPRCPAGLAAFYRFEEADGPVRDECGRHDGSAVGEVARAVPGRAGRAIAFSGGFVVVEGSPDLELVEGATLELWVRVPEPPMRVGGGRRIAWLGGSFLSRGTGDRDDFVGLNTACGNVQALFQRDDGTGATNVMAECGALPPHVWRHVAVVNDGRSLRLYLDGALAREAVGGFLGGVGADLYLGRRSQGVFPLTGAIDELMWWTVARAEPEICGDAGGVWRGRCVL
jgi:hypothetical protein